MSAPPLTHHDIIKRAAPLTRAGFKVNLSACDRTSRYIEFEAQAGHDASVKVIHTLEIDDDNDQFLGRVLIHDSGLVSTLTTQTSNLENAIASFRQFELSRQLRIQNNHVAAYSYSLLHNYRNNQDYEIVNLRFICAFVASVELRIDVSTGGGMPADVRLLTKGKTSSYLRETLADGGPLPLNHRAARAYRLAALPTPDKIDKCELPEDILAILGPQWRPLRHQGDHWKGVMRLLGNREKRGERAERYTLGALDHLQATLTSAPEHYQRIHKKARWQVYARRLQPVMVFVGILSLMPISWLLISSGTMTIHPLALGLTPLLMVGVVVLTAREIPVMEIPSIPAPLPPSAWNASD